MAHTSEATVTIKATATINAAGTAFVSPGFFACFGTWFLARVSMTSSTASQWRILEIGKADSCQFSGYETFGGAVARKRHGA